MSAKRALIAIAVALLQAPLLAQNVVQLENSKPGNRDWVLLNPATNREIEGYASATSVNRGDQIQFFVSTAEPAYTINFYRLGWYNGDGGRKVAGPIARTGVAQTTPAPDPTTGLIECNWSDPYTLTIPNSSDASVWASGVYTAKLTTASGKDAHIVFVVRDDARFSTHYFQTSVTTYQAYNNWGGKSLYAFNSTNSVPARKVSFNRPYARGGGLGEFLRWEYSMVRFLEREGYDVSYCTDVDTHRRGGLIKNHRDYLSIGHDEYWSSEMRANVTAARDAGVNLGFFSANTCYWQIRFEPSTFDASKLDRTIVGYKEDYVHDPYYTDGNPANDAQVTNAWRYAPVDNSEDALLGVLYVADPVDGDIVIDDVTHAPWVFENTGLVKGSVLPRLLGYEVDKIGARTPAGTIRLAHSPFTTAKTDGTPNVSDYSDMTVYTAASGATVFAAGSIQWAWGLDSWNASVNGDRTNAAAQQMTRNILKRFAGSDAINDCQFVLTLSSVSVSYAAGSGSISLSTRCAWTAVPDASWVTVNPPSSGSGNATISYSYAVNRGLARTGHIRVGNRTFTINQAASPITTKGDLDGDGISDIVLRNAVTGDNAVWLMRNRAIAYGAIFYAGMGAPEWQIRGEGDFDGDGKIDDLVLRNGVTGENAIWYMEGTAIAGSRLFIGAPGDPDWRIGGVGDFDGDGKVDDIVLRNSTTGMNAIWFMEGTTITHGALFNALPGETQWVIEGVGDFDRDGRIDDVVLRNYATTRNVIWHMNGASVASQETLAGANGAPQWHIQGIGDFDGDGHANDIVLRNYDTGDNAIWVIANGAIASGNLFSGASGDTAWVISGPR